MPKDAEVFNAKRFNVPILYNALDQSGDTAILKRHPEKSRRPISPIPPKPSWIRVRAPNSPQYEETRTIVRAHKLHTVCEEAACPNIGECWSKSHATMMIMGDICTRGCAFCNIRTGKPNALNPNEPLQVARAVEKLGLKHVVITSVDRDDLPDGGAWHFAQTIYKVRELSPQTTIEVLIPDFLHKQGALEEIVKACPDVINHNIETVPSNYPTIRPGSVYYHSIRLLERVKELAAQFQIARKIFTKSGIMLGLGEVRNEILQVMEDMRSAQVDFLTMGQYLQPTPRHAPIDRFVSPEEFKGLETLGYAKGFSMVASGPLVRSSYHADEHFALLRQHGG